MKYIDGKTKVFGLFGDPVEHSLSPVMHNAAFENENLNCVYVPFHVKKENLKEAVLGIRGLGLGGANVTIPHKQGVMEYIDELSEDARLIGAVNTIKNDNGRLIGYNTDGPGYLRSLDEFGFSCKDKSALVFGAGGASRGICITLSKHGLKNLYLVNRTLEKAEEIAEVVKNNTKTAVNIIEFSPDKFNPVLLGVDLIINTTSQGMHGSGSELQDIVQWDHIKKQVILSDIIYGAAKTPFLLEASRHGLKNMSGERMLLYQGVLAYEIWLGRKAPVDVMSESLYRALKVSK